MRATFDPLGLEEAPEVNEFLHRHGLGELDDADTVSLVGRNDNWGGSVFLATVKVILLDFRRGKLRPGTVILSRHTPWSRRRMGMRQAPVDNPRPPVNFRALAARASAVTHRGEACASAAAGCLAGPGGTPCRPAPWDGTPPVPYRSLSSEA